MKRTTAKALTVTATMAAAIAVAGAGTLSSGAATASSATPLTGVTRTAPLTQSVALTVATTDRGTFSARDAARRTAHLKAVRSARYQAAKHKAARAAWLHHRQVAARAAVAAKKAARLAARTSYSSGSGSPRDLGRALAAQRGWTGAQWDALERLWSAESGWRVTAGNSSGAYGIPQALPGAKMGAGWQSDARVQIRWGLGYIAGRYGSPANAWAHFQSCHWY